MARGHSNVEMEEYPAAILDFGKAIALAPADASNYKYRGEVYAQLRQHNNADADFELARRLNEQA